MIDDCHKFYEYAIVEKIMPLIEYTTFDISFEEKKELISSLSQTASKITGIPLEFFTVIIREVSGPDAWGYQGKPLRENPQYNSSSSTD